MPVVVLLNVNAVTDAQLAEVLGLSVRHVARLTDQNVLRKGRRGYRLSESVQAFVAHREKCIKKESSKFGDSYTRARASRMFALAQIETLRARQLRGELIKSEDADSTFMMILRNARDQLRAIPSRVMHPLTGMSDAREINLLLKGEIDATLNQLADAGKKVKIRREIKRQRETNGEEPVEKE